MILWQVLNLFFYRHFPRLSWRKPNSEFSVYKTSKFRWMRPGEVPVGSWMSSLWPGIEQWMAWVFPSLLLRSRTCPPNYYLPLRMNWIQNLSAVEALHRSHQLGTLATKAESSEELRVDVIESLSKRRVTINYWNRPLWIVFALERPSARNVPYHWIFLDMFPTAALALVPELTTAAKPKLVI